MNESDKAIQEYAKALMDYSNDLSKILNRLERVLEVKDERTYCVKCLINYDDEYLYEIESEPVCFKCAPVMCGDHIRPISECGCQL